MKLIVIKKKLAKRHLLYFMPLLVLRAKRKKQKTAKTYTNAQIFVITISILIISQYSNIIIDDENNDMTPTLNFIAS